MSAYEENFKEKEAQEQYSRRTAVFNFLVLCFLSFLVLWIVMPEQASIFFWFFSVPSAETYTFYISGLIAYIAVRWWWKGLPGFFRRFGVLREREYLFKGKRKVIRDFLYQGVEKSDFLPRADKFYYFVKKRAALRDIQPLTFFDYEPDPEIREYYADKKKKKKKVPVRDKEEAVAMKSSRTGAGTTGTERIILAFRDKKRERYLRYSYSGNPKVSKKWKARLAKYDQIYRDKRRPSPSQISEYIDLMKIMEGILQSYEHKIDGKVVSRIYKRDIKSPLVMAFEKNTGRVVSSGIRQKSDIYSNGKIAFSPEMVISTVERLSYLFWRYFSRVSARQGPIARRISHGGIDFSDIEARAKVMSIFKLMMFRRFMKSYSSIPSSWFCIRIEDYDYRSIVSSIDREMIPVVTSTNNGSNDLYSDDSFSESFLLLWWGFLKSPEMVDIIEKIDWAFNATKDVNEISMREYAKKIAGEEQEGIVESGEGEEK